ncbi:uncharacterized protein LOC124615887 [Schistocerca americana]|uniref:uncharacterized protein LOC124615887 n=1 Tax=Schistocerca americana TaxID=7009 RepID=UPI001F4F444A|nr:uncharacterized protein LOC124615887 [Schistocerca americana]
MNKSGKTDERIHLLKCIQVYRSLPALWKVKSVEYKNKDIKNESYNILLKVFQERYPSATKEDLKRKFNSLRTNFRKELRKVNDRQSVSGLEDTCQSTMWYFEEMKFLIDQESPDTSFSTIPDENGEYCIITDSETSEAEMLKKNPPMKKRQPALATNDLLELACKRLRERVSDEDHIGITWARELQKMDPMQQTFAKKFISDILFEGLMGTLHRNSVVINGPATSSANKSPITNVSSASTASSSSHTLQ